MFRLPGTVLLAAITGCAIAGATVAKPILADARQNLGGALSPYASFLVGRYAMTQGDLAMAANALGAASRGDPANADLREKAFLVGILNGDLDRSLALVADLEPKSDTTRFMMPMLSTVSAIKNGRPSQARKALDAALVVNARARSAVLLKPYVQAMGGQWQAALDDTSDTSNTTAETRDRDRLMNMLVRAEHARLHEIRGQHAKAEAIYTDLHQPGAGAFIFGPDYAAFLERQGRKDEARVIWREIVAQSNDVAAAQALKRLDASPYVKPPLPDLKQSMAQALFMAATLSFSERDSEMALAALRLSLYLDSTSERSRIFLGQVQQELRDPLAAERAWASVPVTSPYAAEATLRRVWSLRGRGEAQTALALTEDALARDADNLSLVMEKANILHDRGDDAGALALLEARMARRGDADFTWQAWFLHAMLNDRLNQWDKAEVSIKKAQAINGTRPEILNFLGYGWINRDINIEGGMDLVRQALAINPKSGAIVDSLGWGYYKLGQYEQALSFVEQAVQLSPSDAEINEHLGDVYKALGRDIEAVYEWQRVLTLNASEKQAAAVRLKLEAQTAKPMTGKKITALNETRRTKP